MSPPGKRTIQHHNSWTGVHEFKFEPSSPGSKRRSPASTRKVAFAEETIEHPATIDLQADQCQKLWYSKRDYRIMKKLANSLSRRLSTTSCATTTSVEEDDMSVTSSLSTASDEISITSSLCTLGVRSQEESKKLHSLHRQAMKAVLEEQELQWEEAHLDSDVMADVYYLACQESRADARQRAIALASELGRR